MCGIQRLVDLIIYYSVTILDHLIKNTIFTSIPANFPREVAQSLPKDLKPGVYYGWAQVHSGPVHKMVVNIGWCPFYHNKEMSVVSVNMILDI